MPVGEAAADWSPIRITSDIGVKQCLHALIVHSCHKALPSKDCLATTPMHVADVISGIANLLS